MICKKVIFNGKVQKIGFRYFVFEQAKQANVVGFVRNLDNGDVELVVQGDEIVISQLIDDCQKKHPLAIIDNILVENTEIHDFTSFDIKRE